MSLTPKPIATIKKNNNEYFDLCLAMFYLK
jgi:hypothetical protein